MESPYQPYVPQQVPPPPPQGGYVPPAPGYGYAPPMYAGGYGTAPIPSPDPARPIAVIGGRPMNGLRYRMTASATRRGTVPFVLLGLLAITMLTIVAMIAAWDRYNMPDFWISLVVGALAAGIFVTVMLGWRSAVRHAVEKIALRQDSLSRDPRLAGPHLTEIYSDRAVMLSAHGQAVIPFREAGQLIETSDMLLLTDRENRAILWMAEDLTPYDADILRWVLYAAVPAQARRIRGQLLPRLSAPLPLPVLDGGEPVELMLTCTEGVRRRSFSSFGLRWRLMMEIPLLLPVAMASVSYAGFTTSYPADIAIAFVLWTALLLLVSGIALSVSNRKLTRSLRSVRIAFTASGMAVNREGFTFFTPWEDVNPRRRKDVVLLESGAGTLTVPWAAAEDPEAFRALIERVTK